MMTSSITAPEKPRAIGRRYLWAGLGLCLLGFGLVFLQYRLRHLIVPWYLPGLTTLGAGLVLYAVTRRVTVIRVLAFGLLAVLAGIQWYFLGSLMRLPGYEGPAQAGQTIPAFQT